MNQYSEFLYVDASNIGFTLTSEMANYEEVCIQDTYAPCTSQGCCVTITGEYLAAVLNKMAQNNQRLNVLTIYINMRQTIPAIGYAALNEGLPVSLKKELNYFTCVLGDGMTLYTDASSMHSYDRKKANGSIKIEVRTFRNSDGPNWTHVYTYPY